MRASDLRINEKRGVLKRLGQTAKSLFSDDAMRDRAVAIIGDQWETEWRQFMKNKATEKVEKEDGTVVQKYPAQNPENKNWIVYPDLFAEFIERKGVNAQVAKRVVNKVAPELSKGPKEIKPKDDVFFNEITRSLIDADALEIQDPEGLIKKVKGDKEVGAGAGAQLTPQEQANEFFGGFVSWAEEAGYKIPESSENTGNVIVEQIGSNELTTEVIKKWLKQEHLSQASSHVVTKFDELIDKSDISTRANLAKMFTDIHFGMVRNFLYDAENKKDRTPDDFNKILNVAVSQYDKSDPDLANSIRDIAKQYGPEKAFTDNRVRLETDGLLTTDERTGAIQGGDEFEQAAAEPKEEKLIPDEVRQEAINLIVGTGSNVEGGEKTEEQAAKMVDAITPEDITPEDAKVVDEVVKAAFDVRAQNREEKPGEEAAEKEPKEEHKRILKIVGDNYFVREKLDPNNHQHMMYYYLADLLGAKEEEEDEK